jgi:hypothetical protein
LGPQSGEGQGEGKGATDLLSLYRVLYPVCIVHPFHPIPFHFHIHPTTTPPHFTPHPQAILHFHHHLLYLGRAHPANTHSPLSVHLISLASRHPLSSTVTEVTHPIYPIHPHRAQLLSRYLDRSTAARHLTSPRHRRAIVHAVHSPHHAARRGAAELRFGTQERGKP